MKRIFTLTIILFITIFAFNSCTKKEQGSVKVEDFSLTLIDEGSWTLSDYKNKPVMLAFMAPHCPYCKISTAMVNKVYKDFSKKGLEVIMIFSNSDLEEVQEFVNNSKIKNKVSYNSKDVARQFKIRGYPYFFLLNNQHIVHEYWIGYHESYDDEIFTEINTIL